jgi:Polyketide cyclase / dehydrase and lipid transport
MFNLFFRVVMAFAALAGLFLLIGSFLPRDFDTNTSVTIAAEPAQIFPYLNDLEKWQSWSPWNANSIKDLSVEIGQTSAGIGATQTWKEPRGDGKLWLTGVDEPNSVEFSSRFANFPEMQSSIVLTSTGAQSTQVTWTSRGALPGGPFYGWFGMAFSTGLQAEYSKALERLKSAVENKGE